MLLLTTVSAFDDWSTSSQDASMARVDNLFARIIFCAAVER